MIPGRWLIFALLFATRSTIAYQFQSVPAVGPLLVPVLVVDYASLGVLIGSYMLPGIAVAYWGGVLDRRFGAKPAMLCGLALMVLGAALSAIQADGLLLTGRLVSGVGAALLNVVLARAASAAFTTAELPLVMGTFVASWPLGVALSLLTVPTVMTTFGWTAVTIVSATFPLVCLCAVSAWYREQPSVDAEAEAAEDRPSLAGITRRTAVLATVAGAIWGLYNVTYVVLTASIPEFFLTRGYSLAEAAAIASVLGWVVVVFLPGGGWIAQRVGRTTLVLGVCFVVTALAALALALTDASLTSLAVLAVILGMPAGLIMATPAQIIPPAQRHAAMGIYFTVFYVAMATLPGAAGIIRERSGTVEGPIVFAAGVIVVGLAAVLLLARLRRNDPEPRLSPA